MNDSRRELVLRLRGEGATYQEIGNRLGVTRERARQLWTQAACPPDRPEWARGLQAQAWHCIRREVSWNRPTIDFATVDGLASFTEAELLDIPNFGQKALAEVQALLSKHGLRLREP